MLPAANSWSAFFQIVCVQVGNCVYDFVMHAMFLACSTAAHLRFARLAASGSTAELAPFADGPSSGMAPPGASPVRTCNSCITYQSMHSVACLSKDPPSAACHRFDQNP